MTTKTTTQLSAFLLACIFAFSFSFSFAYAHGDEDHEATGDDAAKIEHMEKMITILTKLVDLLEQKAKLQGVAVADHHDEEGESDTLKIWVEVHSYKVHAHVLRPHQPLDEFFVDGDYKDEATIIANIAKKTGYSVHEIEDIITFPEGELDAKGDSEHADEEDEDVTGIHIMNDGRVMWGNGSEVEGATITSDDKVKLTDGRIIVPKFDLR